MELNFEKHGLVLEREGKHGGKFYYKHKGKDTSSHMAVEVFDSAGSISIDIIHDPDDDEKKHVMVVASRYKCETQEQLDFLLLNGRAGSFFK